MLMTPPFIATCDQNLQNVVERLENVSLKVINWFSGNCLKLNEDKCHFQALGASHDEPVTIKIGNASVQDSNKLYALSRIAPFMDQGK